MPHHHCLTLPKSTSKLLSLSLKAIIIAFLLIFFFLILAFASFLLLSLCLLRALLHLQNGFASLDFNRLPDFQVAEGTELGDARCVVCLDGFRNGQWCRKLVACGHVLHRRCVDAWLVKVAACPSCRTPVRLNACAWGSLVGAENQEDSQLWTCAISDINAFIALKIQFLAFILCKFVFFTCA